jgi:HEAT repeat protein
MIRKTLLLFSIALFGALSPARLEAGFLEPTFGQTDESRADRAYEEGTKAMDDGDWERAASSFMEVVKANGRRADGALYWVAYSLNKQGRKADALAILSGFAGKYPKSSWIKDARALELEIRQGRGGAAAQPEKESDEDLKLMAINSLLQSEPERAVPLLEKLVKGGSSPKVKERALFVLSQSDSPKAREIVADLARDGSNPELQEKALRYLGVHGGKANRDLLAEVYAAPNSSIEVKEKILKSFMVAGDKDRILAAAKNEKDPKLRASAVRLLGAMGARTEIWQLYQAESSSEVKHSLINALFVAGDSQHLLELARTETKPELRREAIRKLGVMDKEQTGPALVSIYKSEKDPELRKAVISGLFTQNNSHALVEIARSEKDPEMKKEAVKKLSVMGHDKEATDYLMELLKE